MFRRFAAWALVAAAVGWGTAILAAPLVRGSRDGDLATRLAALTYVIGAFVCHQRPDRSFHLAGAQLPVCARCAALYWGGAIGVAVWLLRSRTGGSRAINRTLVRRAIFILSVPIAVTLGASAIGMWDADNAFRAISSAPVGVALGALLAAVVLGDLR